MRVEGQTEGRLMNIANAAFDHFEGPLCMIVRIAESLDDRERRLKYDGPLWHALGDEVISVHVDAIVAADGRQLIVIEICDASTESLAHFIEVVRSIGVPGDARVELEIGQASVSGTLNELFPQPS